MAYYGIPSAGIALTAGSDNDQIGVFGHGATSITAQTIFGGSGNDLINFGAQGFTASLTATLTNSGAATGAGGDLAGTISDPNSIFASQTVNSTAKLTTTGFAQASSTVTLTAAAAITTIDSAFVQANAGNDTIALGTSLSRVTASQFRGGAGKDFIGFGTQLRAAGSFSTATQSGAAFKAVTIVGGSGNDTIKLDNDNTFTGFEISAGAGNDNVNLVSAHVFSARIGLGAGNDIVSGTFGEVDQVSIKGGSGNDTIFVNAAESATIGGDTLDATVGVADGNDSIILAGSITATKVYGGGGNDLVRVNGADISGSSLINVGAGRDTLELTAASVLLHSASIRMGADKDLININTNSGSYISSNIKLGAGNDTIKFTTGTNNIQSGFANTTVFGNAGADLLFESSTIVNGDELGVTFGYNTADSTLAGYDTIAVGGGARSAEYRLEVVGQTMSQLQMATSNFTASNSVVTFTSTFAQDLTARVEALDASMEAGEVAVFKEGNGNLQYLFVQGGTIDDTLVQLGTAAITDFLTESVVTISGTNNNLIHADL
jgi:hypothetical protein